MEDNLYHPCVEPFKHQLYFLGNVAVQYFFNFIFLLFYFSYVLLPKYFSETLSPYVCLIIYYWLPQSLFRLYHIKGCYC